VSHDPPTSALSLAAVCFAAPLAADPPRALSVGLAHLILRNRGADGGARAGVRGPARMGLVGRDGVPKITLRKHGLFPVQRSCDRDFLSTLVASGTPRHWRDDSADEVQARFTLTFSYAPHILTSVTLGCSTRWTRTWAFFPPAVVYGRPLTCYLLRSSASWSPSLESSRHAAADDGVVLIPECISCGVDRLRDFRHSWRPLRLNKTRIRIARLSAGGPYQVVVDVHGEAPVAADELLSVFAAIWGPETAQELKQLILDETGSFEAEAALPIWPIIMLHPSSAPPRRACYPPKPLVYAFVRHCSCPERLAVVHVSPHLVSRS